MDFGMFGFTPDQVDQLRAFMASQQGAAAGTGGQQSQQPQPPTENNSASGAGAGDSQQPQQGPVFMHNAHHAGVVCDICDTEIRGYRYKCAQCPDFDLCSKCEHQGHHAGHVMLRISFPEQARDAIRKYLSNAPNSCPPSPPTPGRHGHGHGHGPHHHGHGHGPHSPGAAPGVEDHPLFGVFGGRRGHCHRRSYHGEEAERPSTAPGCPYGMGKKEFKKWSKWMKRAATHQHRSAEAYARAAASSGTANAAAGSDSEPESPMDFTAVASQIQEFLNYWGIPVDVVELYDQFGNGSRGQPGPRTNASQGQKTQAEGSANAGTEQNQASASNAAAAAGESAAGTTTAPASGTQERQSTNQATADSALTENMQQMRIDETQNNASAPRDDVSLLMELEVENSGWTILNDSREQSPNGNTTEGRPQTETTPTAPPQQAESQPSSATPSTGGSNGNPTPSFASATGSTTNNGNGSAQPSTNPPTYPAGLPGVPLYPVLNPPQIQQILQGVSSAVNSVVRNIPIVSDPRGPFGTNVTTATTGQVPSTTPAATAAPTSTDAPVELDVRSMKTLNQLLAMGFSNEGGYLTRLVVAKKGDLEAVLSSLFPN